MFLSKVKMKNFRCFGDEEQTIKLDKLTAFVGNNSSGKTAVMHAILKLFGETNYDRNLTRSDFNLPKNTLPDKMEEQKLYIETIFEFPEVKCTEDIKDSSCIPIFFKHFIVDKQGGNPYLRIRLEAEWRKSNTVEGSIDSRIYFITCSEENEITDKDKQLANRCDLDNISMIYVPAVRDPSKQLKNVSGTMLYRVLNGINWNESRKNSITAKIDEVNSTFDGEPGVSILKEAIKTQWKNYDSDFRYTNAEMKFNSTDIDTILKKAEIVFSPTVVNREYNINEIGDGLRSLFYISLVNSLLDVENKINEEILNQKKDLSYTITPPLLTIVAVEEPENHISPQLMGKLVGKFKNISEKNNSQTIITSHSPAIIKRIDPENIVHFRISKDKLCTKINKISFSKDLGINDFETKYKYIKEAIQSYPEIYFARLVILGEGDSEEIILPKIIQLSCNDIDCGGISIVPLGGRFVNYFWRLLKSLDIPFITLLDLDRERFGGGWGRIKYALEKLIEISYPKDKVLKLKGHATLTDEQLGSMHKKSVSDKSYMDKWIEHLENYNVFFSYPLDIDFMMIEKFHEQYKDTLTGNEGPALKKKNRSLVKIRDIENIALSKEYQNRIKHDIHQTLKENGGTGRTYTFEQKKLMVWYNYFFLNRGKPTTHIMALTKIGKQELIDNAPTVLKKITNRIKELLSDDPFSDVGR